MITIGPRTLAVNANPGFSILELKGEATRRGIPFTFNTPKGELLEALSSEEVLSHKNFGVFMFGGNLQIIDLDSWKEPGYAGITGHEILGVNQKGQVFFSRNKAKKEEPDVMFIDVMAIDAEEIKSGDTHGPRTLFTLKEPTFSPIGISGNKLVYTTKPSAASTVEILKVLDLDTGAELTFEYQELFKVSIRGEHILVVSGQPYFFTLMTNEGKVIWKEDPDVFGGFDFSIVFLISPTRIVIHEGEILLLYAPYEGKWEGNVIGHQSDAVLGMSKGRLLVSNGLRVNVYDIEKEGHSEEERFLFSVPLDPLREEEQLVEMETEVESYISEMHDGRVVYSEQFSHKTLVLDVDAMRIQSPHDYLGKVFPLPPTKADRKKFEDLIFGNASVPREVAGIIERFI